MLLALLADRPGQLDKFRHLKTHFVFDDFHERDIGRAEVTHVGEERPADAYGALLTNLYRAVRPNTVFAATAPNAPSDAGT